MGNYSTPFPTVIDAVIKALEQALPERVPGGHFGTHSGVRFHGRRADGSFFGTHDSGHGGWGACATHDGAGPFRTMAHGDTRIIPLELQETYLPMRIEEFSLREDSGGAGKFRGGLGLPQELPHAGPECGLQTNLDRTKFPPWGVQGGGSSEARTFHGGRRPHRRAQGDREGERLSSSRRATSSASKPAAAAAMVRRPSGRSPSSSATSTPAMFRRAAARATMGSRWTPTARRGDKNAEDRSVKHGGTQGNAWRFRLLG